jgi:hypothetical protein
VKSRHDSRRDVDKSPYEWYIAGTWSVNSNTFERRVEGKMTRFLVFSVVILLFSGCERSTLVSDPGIEIRAGNSLIVQGFNPIDTAIVGPEGYRVGGYYDLSPFDSVRIGFSAARLNSGDATSQIIVRVGPVNYFRDSLPGQQKDVSLSFSRAALAKPQSSALTFFAQDGDGPLILSHLRVVGW